jgi:hypothetical protein
VKDVIIPKQKFTDFRDYYHRITADESANAVLRKAQP